jgi:hypothetical protein
VATNQFTGQLRLLFAHAFVGAGSGSGSPVQQAVQAALLRGAGIPVAAQPKLVAAAENSQDVRREPVTGPVYTAARHAWLAAHLAAVRAGRLTPEGRP